MHYFEDLLAAEFATLADDHMDNVPESESHSTVRPRVSDRNDAGNIIVPSLAMNAAAPILELFPFTVMLWLSFELTTDLLFKLMVTLLFIYATEPPSAVTIASIGTYS